MWFFIILWGLIKAIFYVVQIHMKHKFYTKIKHDVVKQQNVSMNYLLFFEHVQGGNNWSKKNEMMKRCIYFYPINKGNHDWLWWFQTKFNF
jgi:hypothetical protein